MTHRTVLRPAWTGGRSVPAQPARRRYCVCWKGRNCELLLAARRARLQRPLLGIRDNRYSQCMSLQQDARRQQSVILRIARWKPASYRQVWFVSAPFVASGVLIGGLVAALSEGGFAADRF